MLCDVPLALPGGLPANPYDVHRAVYNRFAAAGAPRHFLFSLEPELGGLVLVRSRALPPELIGQGFPVPVPDNGACYAFRLVATPMWKRNGKTYRLRPGDTGDRIRWLTRNGTKHGFVLVGQTDVDSRLVRYERKGIVFQLDRTVFTGKLEVTNKEAFAAALANGIGRSRAFGFGLLRLF